MSTKPRHILLGYEKPQQQHLGFQRAETRAELNRPIYSSPEGHFLTIGSTGSGKGRGCIIPALLTYPGPALVIDPKGEAAAVTARRRKDFGSVHIIDPFKVVSKTPDTLNPLDLARVSRDSVVELALTLGELLRMDHGGSLKDPFWDVRGNALIAGILAYILTALPQEERHLGTLKNIFAKDDVVYSLAVALDTQKAQMDAFAYKEIAQVLQLPDITRGGVLATAQQHVYLFDDSNVLESVKTTSFDLASFVEGKPMTIYLVLPPSKLKSHAVLLRLWMASLLYALFERDQLPDLPNLFIIDEAAQLGTLNILRTAMTLMRGYGVRCWSFWQDLSQLKYLYSADWQSIINNSGVIQAFGINSRLMAKELAELTGDFAEDQLLGLQPDEQILMQSAGRVQLARKLDYLKDEPFQGLYDTHPLHKGNDSPKQNALSDKKNVTERKTKKPSKTSGRET